ncbi:DUF3320 domain-containing protein [Marinivivus vitaminiproducens]|uniref:DUF3320 domain-containing protein n=1 Tax=Marinivivus vitaminiproducens TaxID=3035935 RepID=UPI0027990168|nr:DUF3320 domain-containing protein [Geminicoccaceae bacterium SCSIO 64248]
MATEAELVSSAVADASEVMDRQAAAVSAHDNDPRRYRVTDLSDFQADAGQFFEYGYRDTLRGMIEAIVEIESPLRADILAQRLARAHGWLRMGGRIRERIELHLRDLDRTTESSGEFIWKKGTVSDVVPYRQPVSEDARRSIADIPLAELVFVVLDRPDLLDEPDPARDLARLLGVERLAAPSRTRLDEAIARARQQIDDARSAV